MPHTLCSELLLIATLLPTFKFVRRNVVRELLVLLATDLSCCKYCDTRSPPPNSRRHRRRMPHLPSRDIETAWSPVSSPDAFFLLTRPQMVLTDFPSVFLRVASTELGGRRVLQLRPNRGLRLDNDRLGRLSGPTRCRSLDFRFDHGGLRLFFSEWPVADVGNRRLFRPRRDRGIDFCCRGIGLG